MLANYVFSYEAVVKVWDPCFRVQLVTLVLTCETQLLKDSVQHDQIPLHVTGGKAVHTFSLKAECVVE